MSDVACFLPSAAGELSNVLQEVELPIIDRGTCSALLKQMNLPPVASSMLCAGFPDGGQDACKVKGHHSAGSSCIVSSPNGGRLQPFPPVTPVFLLTGMATCPKEGGVEEGKELNLVHYYLYVATELRP